MRDAPTDLSVVLDDDRAGQWSGGQVDGNHVASLLLDLEGVESLSDMFAMDDVLGSGDMFGSLYLDLDSNDLGGQD